ncbi:DUF943 family protein [Salmonella enterica]|nr:DUF943 family protein [Salmonella enterica]
MKRILIFLFLLSGVYHLWTLRPVKIIYAYSNAGDEVFLVVDHLPWTDRDKIDWFLKNWQMLREKYPLFEGEWHRYYVVNISDGFTNHEDYHDGPFEDLYCFPTIKSKNSCVVKDYPLIVDEFPYRNTNFYIDTIDGEHHYQLTPENQIERIYQQDQF